MMGKKSALNLMSLGRSEVGEKQLVTFISKN